MPCDINLDAGSFDAIGAFYSITHVPSAEQGSLLAKISWWLKPGGALVASLGAGPEGDWTGGVDGNADVLRPQQQGIEF